jgi:hypothetical protein
MNIPEIVPFKKAFTEAFEKKFGVELNENTINTLKNNSFHFMIHYGKIFFSISNTVKHRYDDEYSMFVVDVIDKTQNSRYTNHDPDIKSERKSEISMKGLDNICKFVDKTRKAFAQKWIGLLFGDATKID